MKNQESRTRCVSLVCASALVLINILGCMMGNNRFGLNDEQVKHYQSQAREGDYAAAKKLHLCFALARDDHIEGVTWIQIAARNGSTEAQQDLRVAAHLGAEEVEPFKVYARKGSVDSAMKLYWYYEYIAEDHEEAHNWLAVAADLGCRQAKEELARINSEGCATAPKSK